MVRTNESRRRLRDRPVCGGLAVRRARDRARPPRDAALSTALRGPAGSARTSGHEPAAHACGRATTPGVVRDELAVLAEHGLNVTRSFCFWPDFVPVPGTLDADVARPASPTSSTRTWSSGSGRSRPSSSGTCPARTGTRRGGRAATCTATSGSSPSRPGSRRRSRAGSAQHPAVVGWLVSNEMPLYGGVGTSEEITAWARLVVQAVRSAGATQPISLGDGAWGVEVSGNDNGYSLRELAPLVDFVGPHVYPMQDDEVRQALTAAFVCELSGSFGKPVVLEEFGVTSDFAADDAAADYYRQILHTTLLAGARGWIAWNNCDYDDLRAEDPYRHHGFEMHFGLTDRTGRPKPQLKTLAEFSAFVGRARRRLGAGRGRRRDRRSRAFRARPSLHDPRVSAGHPRQPLPVLHRGARGGYPGRARARVRRHRHDRPADPRPLRETAPGPGSRSSSRARRRAARRSISPTSQAARPISEGRGFPGSRRSSVCGIASATGSSIPFSKTRSSFEFVRGLGEIDGGAIDVSRRRRGERQRLPARRAGRRGVVAVDQTAARLAAPCSSVAVRPSFARIRLEHLAARTPRANPEDTWRLYSALASEAGVSRPVRVDDPRILVGRIRRGTGELAVFVNCSHDVVAVAPLPDPISRRATPSIHSRSTRSVSRSFHARASHPTRPGGSTTPRFRSPLRKGVMRSGPDDGTESS